MVRKRYPFKKEREKHDLYQRVRTIQFNTSL